MVYKKMDNNDLGFFKYEYYKEDEPIYNFTKKVRQRWIELYQRDIDRLFKIYSSIIKRLEYNEFLWFVHNNSSFFD
jgi:hypothetical protein